MFHVEMQEKHQDTVKIKGFESKVIAILMDYIYEEKIFINRDYAVQIWAAAEYLQLRDVKVLHWLSSRWLDS